MAEMTVADGWIYTTLKADSTLTALIGGSSAPRIYRGMAPLNATFPCVVFFYQPGGQDVRGVGTINIMANGWWVIKAIDRDSSASDAATIAARIYTVLHGKSGTNVLACTREEPINYVELLDGAQYQHVGGVYKLIVS
jgi:hypothetical protein